MPGAAGYRDAVRAENGVVYFRAGNTILAFDPVAREIVSRSEAQVDVQMLCAQLVGSKKQIVGIGDGAIVAIDPADHQCRVVARHESLRGKPRNRGVFVDSGLNLYYGKGSHLWRCRLSTLD